MAARIGGRMMAVADYVAANPGVCKAEAARGIGQTSHSYGGGWGPVDRAIRAGLVVCDWERINRSRLFRTVADMQAFYGYVDDGHWHPAGHP